MQGMIDADFLYSAWTDIFLDMRLIMASVVVAVTMILLYVTSPSISSSQAEAFQAMVQRKIRERSDSILSPIHSVIQSESTRGLEFLNDLSPPFSIYDDLDALGEMQSPDVTHFCFLIHGHRGKSSDLSYMQTVMKRWGAIQKRQRMVPSMSESSTSTSTSSSASDTTEETTFTSSSSSSSAATATASSPSPSPTEISHDFVVYSPTCNEYKTTDGIRNGGDRLVEELKHVLDTEMKKRHPELSSSDGTRNDDVIPDLTISILGNSLGGLYGRYAIPKLLERYCQKENAVNGTEDGDDDSTWILDGKYRLHLNIFCTTATPHLGTSRHTYIRIPRTAEIGFAHAMGDTGKDLFRLNDLLSSMATCPTFIKPLAAFRKRVAYANAYGTDFPVPTCTAAFLSEGSSYPHHFQDDEPSSDDGSGLIIATLHTSPTDHQQQQQQDDPILQKKEKDSEDDSMQPSSSEDDGDYDHELTQMSLSLDRLGWKKIFVDIREKMPSVEVPKSLRWSTSDDDGTANTTINALRQQKVVQSKDLASVVAAVPTDNRFPVLPLGHNMIVAFSRSKIQTFLNKAGRPVVDSLAKELVDDIFSWTTTTTTTSSSSTTTTTKENIQKS